MKPRELERKIARREKALKFQEELRNKRFGGSKPCRITKGEHIYDVPIKTGSAYWVYYDLRCKCGKKDYKNSTIYSLKNLPKYSICQKHGYIHGEGKECWACLMDLEPF